MSSLKPMKSSKKNRKSPARTVYILGNKTPFPVREAYKAARTNIMFSLPQPGCKTVLFTSSAAAEGKTTVCLNSAITFAQTGAKVMVIDGDLRRPRVHKMLRENNVPGLTNLLGNFCSLENVIRTTPVENLHFISAGSIPPNPAELLGSEGMRQLLEVLQEQYDYVFTDTPPIGVVTDALSISNIVSGVVMVVRQNSTNHDALQHAVESLEFAKAKILGFVLNDVTSSNGLSSSFFGKKGAYYYAYEEHK